MKNINIYILVVITILWIFQTGCGVASFYRKGVQCFQKHEYSEAVKWLEKSQESGENKPLSAYFLGVSYEKLGNHEKSVFWLNNALNSSENTEIKREVIENLLKTAQINRAIEIGVNGNIVECEKILIDITGSEFHYYLGLMYAARKEFNNSLQEFYSSFVLTNRQSENSYIANLWNAIGETYQKKFDAEGNEGDFYQACFAYRLAVSMQHPVKQIRDTINEHYTLITNQPLFKNYKPIVDSFNRISRYRETKNYSGVIEEAHNIIETSPVSDDRFFGWYIIGRAYYEQKDYQNAIEFFKRAKEYSETKRYLVPADLYTLLDKIYEEFKESETVKE